MTLSVRQLGWVVSNELNALTTCIRNVKLEAAGLHLSSRMVVMCVLVTLVSPEFSRNYVPLP